MSGRNVHLSEEAGRRYRARTGLLAIVGLLVWLALSLALPWFARDLNEITMLGFPLGYYMMAQGSPIVFVATLFWLNLAQDKVDDEFGIGD